MIDLERVLEWRSASWLLVVPQVPWLLHFTSLRDVGLQAALTAYVVGALVSAPDCSQRRRGNRSNRVEELRAAW